MYQIVSQPAPPLNAAKLGIPAALESIVNRAMAKDAHDRYPSALEMANALTAIRAGLNRDATGSKTVSLRSAIDMGLTAERAAKQRKANRRTAAFGGSGVAAIALTSVRRLRAARKTAGRATGRRRPRRSRLLTSNTEQNEPDQPRHEQLDDASAKRRDRSRADPASGSKGAGKDGGKGSDDAGSSAGSRAADDGARESAPSSGGGRNGRAVTRRRRSQSRGRVARQRRQGLEAAVKLSAATTAWSAAEREARLAAAAATAALAASARTKTIADSPKQDPVAPPQVAPIKPVSVPAPAPNPSAEIEIGSRRVRARDRIA